MLTLDGCRARVTRLRSKLDTLDSSGQIDAVVVHRPEHLLYLANFLPELTSLNYNSSSFLVIDADGRSPLFVDNWLAPGDEPPAESAIDDVVVTTWYDCVAPAQNRSTVVAASVTKHLQNIKARRIAAERSVLPVTISGDLDVLDVEPLIRELRQIKDPDELAAIRRGIRTAEAIHAASRGSLREGMTELDFYSQLVQRAIVAAEAPFVMMCDLASGPRAAQGGGGPTLRVMKKGELVILDIFPLVEGYRGDITNTLVVGAQPTTEQQELFDTVHSGLEAGASLLHPETPVKEVYRAIDETFHRSDPARSLIHHAGHAIGLGHPEAPEIVPESDAVLTEGMVITLEPGLYGVPSGGIRLEHDYLITKDGAERLSEHSLGLA